jgi:hypothetical protein
MNSITLEVFVTIKTVQRHFGFLARFHFVLTHLVGQNIKFEHYNDNNSLSHAVRHIVQDDTGGFFMGGHFRFKPI